MCCVFDQATDFPRHRAAANCRTAETVAAVFTILPHIMRSGTAQAKRHP
jgi:hypothetical protein